MVLVRFSYRTAYAIYSAEDVAPFLLSSLPLPAAPVTGTIMVRPRMHYHAQRALDQPMPSVSRF